ncbi:MAG: hypothetical protein IPH18_07585 [Chitinophagaceae bacterium]|nr:hypothetical protein [Chitinophagaceae bacterium]
MSKLPFNLMPEEQVIDTWTLLYSPPGGGKFNGKLTVTNKRLLYDAQYDVSAKGLLSEAMFAKWGSEGYLEIIKSDITDVKAEKSFLAKKAILTLSDGSKHTFNYGMLSIDKVITAINER